MIQNPYPGQESGAPSKVIQFFRLVGPIITQVSMKLVHYFFSNPAHRRKNDHITYTLLAEVMNMPLWL